MSTTSKPTVKSVSGVPLPAVLSLLAMVLTIGAGILSIHGQVVTLTEGQAGIREVVTKLGISVEKNRDALSDLRATVMTLPSKEFRQSLEQRLDRLEGRIRAVEIRAK